MNRHQRRKAAAEARRNGQDELAEKIGMFSKLGDECAACGEPFDKENREMVNAWFVTVRKQEKKVRLYCPTCWETAQKVVEEYEHAS